MTALGNGVQSLGLYTELNNVAIRNSAEVNKGGKRAHRICGKNCINGSVKNGEVCPLDHGVGAPRFCVLSGALNARNLLDLGKESVRNLLGLLVQRNALIICAQLAIVFHGALMEVIILKTLVERSVALCEIHNFSRKISHIKSLLFLFKIHRI